MNELTASHERADDLVSPIMPRVEQGPVTFSGDIAKLFAAMARAQANIGVAHKKSNNPAFKSKYADLSQVWDAIQEALPAEELCLIQMPHTDGKKVSLTTVIGHASGAFMSCVTSLAVANEGAHAVGGGITYLRRFAGAAMAGVVQADDDGNTAEAKNHNAGQRQALPPAPPSGSMREEANRITGRETAPPVAAPQDGKPTTLKLIGSDRKEYEINASTKTGTPVEQVWLAAFNRVLGGLGSPEEVDKWCLTNRPHIAVVDQHWPEIAKLAFEDKASRAEFLEFPGNRPSRQEPVGAK